MIGGVTGSRLRSLWLQRLAAGSAAVAALSAAVPTAGAAIIGVNFGGGSSNPDPDPSFMQPGEIAGVAPQANWNSRVQAVDLAPSGLVDDTGAATSATLAWQSSGVWDTSEVGGTDVPGNRRMMMGYIDTSNTSLTRVIITGLPAAFQATGYNVIVYYDGDNGPDDRVGRYTIGGTTLYGRDAAGVTFDGAFVQAQTAAEPAGPQVGNPAGAAAAPAGNYLVFAGLTGPGFELNATGSVSADEFSRAPVNGIQIVPGSRADRRGRDGPRRARAARPSPRPPPKQTVTTFGRPPPGRPPRPPAAPPAGLFMRGR